MVTPMTDDALRLRLERVAGAVAGWRFRSTSELALQARVAQVLREAQIPAEAEVALTPRARVDFLAWGSIAVELNVKGPYRDVERQLCRYARLPSVDAVVLVTTVYRHALQLRGVTHLEGKPLLVLDVSTSL